MPPGRIPHVVNSPEKIQLQRLSHVYYSHVDFTKFERFAKDFGFEEASRDEDTVYYRGWGRDAYSYVASLSTDGKEQFGGGAFMAKTKHDFLKASQLESASAIQSNKGPGGGEKVSITSPSGSIIHVIWGCKDREVQSNGTSKTTINFGGYNTPLQKYRKGEFQRFKTGPAMIHKLGHYGFSTPMFDEDVTFYTECFNFVPSDILYEVIDGRQIDVLTFMHLDHGVEYTDHHTLFLFRGLSDSGSSSKIHHSSFEVDDFDTQLLGHNFLLSKGYKPVWGVGRHILGSQIFDYWKDPSGFTVEHYADGDVVNSDTPTGREQSHGDASMYVWGPERPKGGVGEP